MDIWHILPYKLEVKSWASWYAQVLALAFNLLVLSAMLILISMMISFGWHLGY
jgi:hypothetical protein